MVWPKLMKAWTQIDFSMADYEFPKNLKMKFIVITSTLLLGAVGMLQFIPIDSLQLLWCPF